MASTSPGCPQAVVVGAGVIGCSVALELRRSGYDVTVVDRNGAPGQGSTSASSAVVRYHYRHRDEAVVAWESGLRWSRWESYLGAVDPAGMAGFMQTGLVLIDGEILDLSEALGHLHDLGVHVEELTGEQVRERFPALDPTTLGPPTLPDDERFWRDGTGDAQAWWMPECGYVDDPMLAAHNLAHAGRSIGVTYRFRTSVTGVTSARGRVTGCLLDDETELPASVIVNAAGPWSATLNELAGVLDDFQTSTRPLEQEVISLPAPPSFATGAGGACVTDADLGTYFRPHGEDTVIVGGMEPPCDPLVWLDAPSAARTTVSLRTWEMQSLRLARRVPDVRIPNQPRGVVGVYDVTDDWTPIYDKTNLAGFYVAIGTSGHGFKQAPFVGELLAALVHAVENGHDHDHDPLQIRAQWSGQMVNLGHFSRLREVTPQAAMG
jgi:sarcosine oxidase subunit beta